MTTPHPPDGDGLFGVEVAYDDNPVNPQQDRPTPADVVAALSRNDRALRVRHLTSQAHAILAEGTAAHLRGRSVAATCVLLSGGDDSTAIAHIFRKQASHFVHVNTGTGIPQTTEFVREVTAGWGVPLIEVAPPNSYRDLVLGRVKTKGSGEDVWPGGFPGPGAHGTMYQRLKELSLDQVRHILGIANSRTECAVWIAGRRRQESERRADIPRHEADGSVTWVSPVVNWTKLDLATYRQLHDVPRNPVSANIHMSGECLCGAFAKPGEMEHIGFFYPEVKARFEALQEEVTAAGVPEPWCTWGHGQGGSPKKPSTGRLCSSCDALWTAA
jgi:3'-phosphoadenosine 5'-phosphosulfate sulfotransferase (PAPS reductase)/FAD synthetase